MDAHAIAWAFTRRWLLGYPQYLGNVDEVKVHVFFLCIVINNYNLNKHLYIMKQIYLFKRLFASFVLLLMTTLSWAYDFEVDGICYNINSDGTSVTVTYKGTGDKYSGAVVIPETVTYSSKVYSVTIIGPNAFSDCPSLTSVTIPEGVKLIGGRAFSYCSSLASVTIPNSITQIEFDVFSGCESLKRVEFASVKSICNISYGTMSSNPLYYAKHLYIDGQEVTDLIIPNGVTSINSFAFVN